MSFTVGLLLTFPKKKKRNNNNNNNNRRLEKCPFRAVRTSSNMTEEEKGV